LLRPLDISGARIVRTRADLAGVAMESASSYHPGWVYHGLAVGPLRDAALLLDRLMTGALLRRTSSKRCAKRAHSASRIRGVRGIGPAMGWG